MKHTKKNRVFFGLLLVCLLSFSSGLPDSSASVLQARILINYSGFSSENPGYVPGEVLVKFKSAFRERNIRFLLSLFSAKDFEKIPDINIYKVKIAEGISVEEMVYAFKQSPAVEYAQPNYIYHLHKTPNDPLFIYQYALNNTGQGFGDVPSGGKPGADIKASPAWEETTGSENVIIAIVDTGVDLDHPDLKNKVKSSGYDFINKDYDASDDNWHGTHMAGIAAAESNNKEGIAGVAWNCKILPVKVFNNKGEGGTSDIISQGIRYAADNEAGVINLSFGQPSYDQTVLDAVKYAYDKNVVIVASTGNDNSAVSYPAAFDNYCLAVAATDYFDLRWDRSNYGAQVDVAAPGIQILSTVPPELDPKYLPYTYASGTSTAAAHVAGLAALIKSIKPWLKASEVMNVIRYAADDVNSDSHKGRDDFIGYGRVNMEKALVPLKIK